MELGMIGLGRMGTNMVRRLMQAGHHCVVYDIHPEAVEIARQGRRGRRNFTGRLCEEAEKASRHLDDGAGRGGGSDAGGARPHFWKRTTL